MPRSRSFASALFALIAFVGCSSKTDGTPEVSRQRASESVEAAREPLEVFAAASFRDVGEALAAAYEEQGGARIVFNFAASSALARQLQSSARGDVFLSADQRWVEFLEESQSVVLGSKHYFASNTMVVVAHPNSTYTLDDPSSLPSLRFDHLALATPETVPAGRYAKAFLESVPFRSSSVWTDVEPRVAPAADVRGALALVEADSRTIGIVYRTDVRRSRVRTLYEIPRERMPVAIRYVAIAMAGRAHLDEARDFVAFLGSPAAKAILVEEGFLLPAPTQ